MPTYEYLCKTCSHRFETWQKMSEEPLTACPECGGVIRRVLFPAGVVFKGSGFYKTDHPGKKADEDKPAASNESASTSESTSTSESSASPQKAESKPASSSTSENKPATASTPK